MAKFCFVAVAVAAVILVESVTAGPYGGSSWSGSFSRGTGYSSDNDYQPQYNNNQYSGQYNNQYNNQYGNRRGQYQQRPQYNPVSSGSVAGLRPSQMQNLDWSAQLPVETAWGAASPFEAPTAPARSMSAWSADTDEWPRVTSTASAASAMPVSGSRGPYGF